MFGRSSQGRWSEGGRNRYSTARRGFQRPRDETSRAAVDAGDQLAQQSREHLPFPCGLRGSRNFSSFAISARKASSARTIPSPGQDDVHAAPVARRLLASDQARLLEAIETMREAAGGEHQRRVELGRRQPVWRAGATQRCDHVELSTIEVERGEGRLDTGAHEISTAAWLDQGSTWAPCRDREARAPIARGAGRHGRRWPARHPLSPHLPWVHLHRPTEKPPRRHSAIYLDEKIDSLTRR